MENRFIELTRKLLTNTQMSFFQNEDGSRNKIHHQHAAEVHGSASLNLDHTCMLPQPLLVEDINDAAHCKNGQVLDDKSSSNASPWHTWELFGEGRW